MPRPTAERLRRSPAAARAARPAPPGREAALAPRVGWLAAGSAPGRLRADWPGNGEGPVEARAVVPLDGPAVEAAVRDRRPVVLLFEDGDERRPIVVGLVQSSTPLLDAVLGAGLASAPAAAPAEGDGRRRLLRAEDELVLECGKASITLRRNGKVVIRGTYVETRSAGTNRIKGGAVKIN